MIYLVSNIILSSLSLIVFMVVIVVLVIVLLIAKRYLVVSGEVRIKINDDKEIQVKAGSSLLSTLASEHIFLPSACGGGGSCAQCKCQVLEGGGEVLPTEKVHFSRKQIQNNWRLGCQVKVRDDMSLKINESILGVKKWECEVVSNRNVATFIKEFVVRLPQGEHLNFTPGGYVQVDIPPYEVNYRDFTVEERFRIDWDKADLWSLKSVNKDSTMRAYSMANYPAEGNVVMLNVRIATPPFDRAANRWSSVPPGIASSYIFNLKPGDKVMVSGPFGEFFPNFNSSSEMLYIGGGAGMAPLRSHILHLLKTLNTTNRTINYWYGARSKKEVFYEEDFRALEEQFPNFKFYIALSDPQPEDEWDGYVGFIHEVILKEYLSKHESPEDIEYYMCGPGPMSKAIEKMLWDLGVSSEMLRYDNFGA